MISNKDDSKVFSSNIHNKDKSKPSVSPYRRISVSKSPAKLLNNWLLSPKKLKKKSNVIKGGSEVFSGSIIDLKNSDINEKNEIELENNYIFKDSQSISRLVLRDDSIKEKSRPTTFNPIMKKSNIIYKIVEYQKNDKNEEYDFDDGSKNDILNRSQQNMDDPRARPISNKELARNFTKKGTAYEIRKTYNINSYKKIVIVIKNRLKN
jgi:hypothetical protein